MRLPKQAPTSSNMSQGSSLKSVGRVSFKSLQAYTVVFFRALKFHCKFSAKYCKIAEKNSLKLFTGILQYCILLQPHLKKSSCYCFVCIYGIFYFQNMQLCHLLCFFCTRSCAWAGEEPSGTEHYCIQHGDMCRSWIAQCDELHPITVFWHEDTEDWKRCQGQLVETSHVCV